MSRERKIALALVAVLAVVGGVFLITFLVGQGLERASLWATVLGLPVGIATAVIGVLAGTSRPAKPPGPAGTLLPAEMLLPDWVVDRSAEVEQVVEALLSGQRGTVGITTALHGVGGFGKTTLAHMVCADGRVRQAFSGRVHVVTLGRDLGGVAETAAKVNDVIKLVSGREATYTDPELAGRMLGALLNDGPRWLLVLDDVWEPEQLAPFASGGRQCTRLVTTRVPGLLAGRGVAVRVDQMSGEQSRRLLTTGLPALPLAVTEGLLAVTGRWPLLLRLVNRVLSNASETGADVRKIAAQLLGQLRAAGPAVVDDLLGSADLGLRVERPQDRARAVRATIEASTSVLSPQDAQRFLELGIFAEDEVIPVSLITRLWGSTGGLDELRSSQLCARLATLALVSVSDANGGLTIHDVIRDFLRGELGPEQLRSLTGLLLDATAKGLPRAVPLSTTSGPGPRAAWWELGRRDRYLQDHLIEHLGAAGLVSEAEEVACDLRWLGMRLRGFGPAALVADLSLIDSAKAARLRALLTRTAHLLAPCDPAEAVVDVLHSRVAEEPDLGPQVTALRDRCHEPRLVNRWPLPDVRDSALRFVLAGHEGPVRAMAIVADGSWLATASADGTARIWDPASARQQAVLISHDSDLTAVAIAPDGSWLATASTDTTIRVWDVASWQEHAVLTGHHAAVSSVAVSRDNSCVVTADAEGMVRVWDVASWQERIAFPVHDGAVNRVAVAPDGGWAVAVSSTGTARVWDVATGQPGVTLSVDRGERMSDREMVTSVAVAPDGSWVAIGSFSGPVRIVDPLSGLERGSLTGLPGQVINLSVAADGAWLATSCSDETRIWSTADWAEQAVVHVPVYQRFRRTAVAPDGTWLATANDDGTAWIWNCDSRQSPTCGSYDNSVRAITVAPDGSWLAAGSVSGNVRLLDTESGRELAVLAGHVEQISALAVSSDGRWLASLASGADFRPRVWDVAAGRERAALAGHQGTVSAVAFAPDGSWLVTAGTDGTARIWDPDGRERAVLAGHQRFLKAVAVAPDGRWIATAGYEGTVRIWDPASGREQAILTVEDFCLSMAVAPDGTWLATGGKAGTVQIWDPASWQERAIFAGHGGSVVAAEASPDGSWLATVGTDSTVRIWDPAGWRAQALMRVEEDVFACAWLGAGGIAVGGLAGLYAFDLLARTSQAPAGSAG